MRFRTWVLFVLLWTTFVYDLVAHWIWSRHVDDVTGVVTMGWLRELGCLDFAGTFTLWPDFTLSFHSMRFGLA
jgi:Amt family ammonium transporter